MALSGRPTDVSPRPPAAQSRSALVLWGWGRLLLGVVQMALAGLAIFLLISEGLTRKTWVIIIAGCIAVVTSRVLFRGRRGPGTQ